MNKMSRSSQGGTFIDKDLNIMTHCRSAIGSLVLVSAHLFYPGRQRHHHEQTSVLRRCQGWRKSPDGVCVTIFNKTKNKSRGQKCAPQQAIMRGEELTGSISLWRCKQCATTPFKMSPRCDRNNIPLLLPGCHQGKTQSHADTIIFKTPAYFFSFFSNIVGTLSVCTLTVLIGSHKLLYFNVFQGD